MRFLNRLFLGLSFATLYFLLLGSVSSKQSATAIAGIIRGYIPPFNRPFLQRTEGSGTRRGCEQAKEVYLQLLVPKDHVALSIAEHPAFLFYLSELPTLPVRFTLIEVGKPEPILEKQIKVDKPGVVQLALPTNAPKLHENKQYQWTVSLICNQKHPAENIYAQAKFERVPIPPKLQQRIKVSEQSQKAEIYAQAGIWYDAVANLYQAHIAHPNSKAITLDFWELLNQANLSRVVAQEQRRTKISVVEKQ